MPSESGMSGGSATPRTNEAPSASTAPEASEPVAGELASSSSTRPRGLFRDTIEASVSALVVALLIKLFALEAYRIPSGSMQPTLFGHEAGDGHALKDTVLVDRLAYLRGDPRRFDVAVFRFPLDTSRTFVKRIWGLPGDTLRIWGGDVQRREPEGSWRTLARPAEVMAGLWLTIDNTTGWDLRHVQRAARDREPNAPSPRGGGAALDGSALRLAPPRGDEATLVFPAGSESNDERARIEDLYRDGLPVSIRSRVAEGGGREVVGDLRVEFDLTLPDVDDPLRAHRVIVELFERGASGWQSVRAELTAVTSDGSPLHIFAVDGSSRPTAPEPPKTQGALETWAGLGALRPGATHHIRLQNLDDHARLEVDGVGVGGAVDPIEPEGSYVRIRVDGAARIERLSLARDVHYTLGRAATDTWTVPAEHYFVLGDNTQRSVDSRAWRLVDYRFVTGPRAGEDVLGQEVPGTNPATSFSEGPTPTWYFRDQFGERQRLPTETLTLLEPIEAPFVPRASMVGRAFASVWVVGAGAGDPGPRWIR